MKPFTRYAASALLGPASLCIAAAAAAQDTMPPPDDTMEDEHGADEAPPPPASTVPDPAEIAADYTDQQVESFARAALRMRSIAGAADMDEFAREAAARAIVVEEGLDPATFAAMQEFTRSDPAFAMRVQQAIETVAAGDESR